MRQFHVHRAALAVAMALAATMATVPAFAEFQGRYGQVPYASGGITSDEADAMRAKARDYSLEITMAAPSPFPGYNDFVAGTAVRVTDGNGIVVLEAPDTGPILLADLPPGNYTIEAVDNGQVQTRHVHVGPRGRTQLTFLWR
ncbi:MAG TPA: carboxypeptidase regulatory-like domain-containing protein [Casimicrobiaceae bacterium]|nr:carboxypeptidase regulatory-like domain-containing protein [Casimicrobiaceae bacterium]